MAPVGRRRDREPETSMASTTVARDEASVTTVIEFLQAKLQ